MPTAVSGNALEILSREQTAAAHLGSASGCPELFELQLPIDRLAHFRNLSRGVTEIYVKQLSSGHVVRYDISPSLSVSETPIPEITVKPEAAGDLDLDGEPELLCVDIMGLYIYSSPDWVLRGQFDWSAYPVFRSPVVVNMDADPYLEVHATPTGFSAEGRIVVIDYDPSTDAFVLTHDVPAPYGAAGPSAIADFDYDGRIEIITGDGQYSYQLYELREGGVVHIGRVSDSIPGNNAYAIACRPLPGGKPHALLGHSSSAFSYRYDLLEATGDNEFAVVTRFHEQTGGGGLTPCGAVDTDCDGLDELAMHFGLPKRKWEWDVAADSFQLRCTWEFDSTGSFTEYFSLDLNWDGMPDLGALNHNYMFRVYTADSCSGCDSTGTCVVLPPPCFCPCGNDPLCDGVVSDVADIVKTIDVAFRGSAANIDTDCPFARSDVNRSGATDVSDVIHVIDVAFRGSAPVTSYQPPCP